MLSYIISKAGNSNVEEIGGGMFALMIIGIIVLIIWTITWKALALWKSARQGQKVWFVILLIVNTVGVLEIIYLLLNRKAETSPKIEDQVTPPTDQIQ